MKISSDASRVALRCVALSGELQIARNGGGKDRNRYRVEEIGKLKLSGKDNFVCICRYIGGGRVPASEIAIILDWPSDTVIVSETIYSYGGNDHVVARKSSSGRSIDGE